MSKKTTKKDDSKTAMEPAGMSPLKQFAASAQSAWDHATQSVWEHGKKALKTTADDTSEEELATQRLAARYAAQRAAQEIEARCAPAMPVLETASNTVTDPAATAAMPAPTAEDRALDAQGQKLSPDSKLLFGCMSTLLDQKLSPVESRVQMLEQGRAAVDAKLEGMQQQMQRLELNVHAIVYAERLAQEACAHQVRAFKYDAGAINWDGLTKPRTTVAAGSATVLTFDNRREAAAFAAFVRKTRPGAITCRPEIPPQVMKAQAPLRRALKAYKSILAEDEKENVAIDYDPTRSIIHGTKFVVVTCQDGSIVPAPDLDEQTRLIVWEAIHDNDYLKNQDPQGDVTMPDSERTTVSRRRRSKPKTRATSSPITPPTSSSKKQK